MPPIKLATACAATLLMIAVCAPSAGAATSGAQPAQAPGTGGTQVGWTPPPAPTVPGEEARIGPDGLAIAPAAAPPEVRKVIAAGNRIARTPYRYGGGHGRWRDRGYDCSGSISYALFGARLVKSPLNSSGFMRWGERGRGKWITIYAHGGHAYMTVAGLRFDTSGRSRKGTRWQAEARSARGYRVRHPAGL